MLTEAKRFTEWCAMPLKFPNARLHIYNLLADQEMTGAGAIACSAFEFGLIDELQLQRLKQSMDDASCHCMEATKGVVIEYFGARQSELDHDQVNHAWSVLESEVRKYDGTANEINCGNAVIVRHDCTKFAPVLFDLMLQQLRRYS